MVDLANHLIALATKHRRRALVVSVSAFATMFAFMLVTAATVMPKAIFVGGFALLFATAVLGWGVVLLGSWFVKPTMSYGGVQRFAGLVWRGFAVFFLVVWFCFGLGLVVLAVTAFMASA
jgi:hypothetical protein